MKELKLKDVSQKRINLYQNYVSARASKIKFTPTPLYILKFEGKTFELNETEYIKYLDSMDNNHLCSNCSRCSAKPGKDGCQKVRDFSPLKGLEKYPFITSGISSDFLEREKFVVERCSNYIAIH